MWLVRIFMGYDGAARRVYQNKTIHGTKKDAESYLAEAIRQRDLTGTDSAAQRTLMRELFTDLLADYRVNNKGVKWAEQKIRLHLEPAFGETRVRNLTTTLVREYVHERQKSEAANATINRELAVLKRALNLGRRHTPPKVVRGSRIRAERHFSVRNAEKLFRLFRSQLVGRHVLGHVGTLPVPLQVRAVPADADDNVAACEWNELTSRASMSPMSLTSAFRPGS